MTPVSCGTFKHPTYFRRQLTSVFKKDLIKTCVFGLAVRHLCLRRAHRTGRDHGGELASLRRLPPILTLRSFPTSLRHL